MNAPAIWPAIVHAYENPDVAARAQELWAEHSVHLFKPHRVELSASSAGHCVLERWAYLHGKLDLGENWATVLAKMDGGTMYGLRVASLFAAGYEATHPGAKVTLEVVTEHEGIPGHIDARVEEGGGTWILEAKASFWTGEFSGPMKAHFIQAADYGFGQAAEGFSIATLLPAAQKKRGSSEPATHFVQTDRYTDDYATDVRDEYARLQQAKQDEPPEPDAKEPFWCVSCRASFCERNKNPLKPKEAAHA